MIFIDMTMPDNCSECRFDTESGFCKAMPDNFCGYTRDYERPEWCPLKDQEPVEAVVGDTLLRQCGKCGFSLASSDNFCSHCGMAVKRNA